ncbi:MAG TPA: T9SS type A sorting domain-containing protein [Hanamia sp.]|nr:T9SS type A sorting domain-containing protein [Hanamia sp.]
MSLVQSFVPQDIYAQVNFSYSYFNITRNNGGGTLEKGDIIEIHALAYVATGTTVSNFYFTDSIRTGTQYVPNSMKIVTNEGVKISGSMTDASGDDQSVYDVTSVPRIRINLGPGFSNAQAGANYSLTTGGGKVVGGTVPIAGPGTLAIVAYRLLITANYGDTIWIGGNFYYNLWYKNKPTVDTKYHFDYYGVKVIQNQGLCPNFSSASFSAESSFGSGSTQNRPTGIIAPGYTKMNITTSAPNDNYYAIVNNTSGTGSTDNTVPYKVGGSPRVFGAWDIIGDHTGAASPTLGNAPVSPGQTGGYMLVVNADYNTGEAYNDVIKNVCPNTYYEFSAWIYNLCGQCGADMNGNPYPPPTHGVMPNLTYTINNIDFYTTGNIQYTGTWVKKGFVYKTGPTETQFTIAIKNNASGGDGNDWALDDINLSTCYPNLIMNPSDTASVCAGFPVVISDTVKSYYNNYSFYQWEASLDGGVTWVSVGPPGTGVPVLVNGLYQYHVEANYNPAAIDSGHYIRIRVATTLSNLTNPNCSVANSQKVFLKVYSKCSTLQSNILNFNGSVINKQNVLQWTVKDDENIKEYVIEKSTDAVHFSQAGIVQQGGGKGDSYTFTDPGSTSSLNYYRLKIVSIDHSPDVYSNTVLLYNRNSSALKVSAVNPFRDNLKVEVFLPTQGKVEMNLFDMYGNILRKKVLQLNAGNSQVTFDNVSNLPVGMYILNIFQNGETVQKKLIKEN